MRYYVIAQDGQKYGPADIPTLQQWVDQGRIIHNTVLEEETGGLRYAAAGLGTLRMGPKPAAAPSPDPYQSNPYAQPSHLPNPNQPNPYQQNPYQNNPYQPGNYYRPGHAPDDAFLSAGWVTTSWVLFAISLAGMAGFCCGPFAIVGIILAIIGAVFGNKAKVAGHPQAHAPYFANLISIAVNLISLLFFGALFYAF